MVETTLESMLRYLNKDTSASRTPFGDYNPITNLLTAKTGEAVWEVEGIVRTNLKIYFWQECLTRQRELDTLAAKVADELRLLSTLKGLSCKS